MVYAVKSLALICKLKKNPKLSVECYERTLQAIHVTLADTIRENNKVKHVVLKGRVYIRPDFFLLLIYGNLFSELGSYKEKL